MKMLLTGFEPFSGMEVNPSQVVVEVLKELKEHRGRPIEIIPAILPVRFRDSALQLQSLIRDRQPEMVLSFGVDLGKPNIELESTAHLHEKYIDQDYISTPKAVLPEAYLSALPLDDIAHRLQAAKHRVIVSDDTGSYVCNHVYYLANQWIKEQEMTSDCLFVHIPYPFPYYFNREQVVPDYSMEEINTSCKSILASLIDYHFDKPSI